MTANRNIARAGAPSGEDVGDPPQHGGADDHPADTGAARSSLTDRMRSFLGARWLGVVGGFDGDRPLTEPCLDDPGFVRVLADDEIAWPATAMLDERRTLVGRDEHRHLSLVTVDWWDTTAQLRVGGPATRRQYSPVGVDYDGPATDWYVLSVEEATLDPATRLPRLAVERRCPDGDAGSRTTYDRLVPDVEGVVGSRMAAFLTTADADGRARLSSRVGPAGFVQVLDAHTLAWPESHDDRNGALADIEARGTAGLYFPDWWTTDATVQVSGSTTLLDDVAGATDLTDDDRATQWVLMDVERATVARDPPLPELAVEAHDPQWTTDGTEAPQRGFVTDG